MLGSLMGLDTSKNSIGCWCDGAWESPKEDESGCESEEREGGR